MIRFPPKRILVPFDFTDVSQAAWEQAVWLAERFTAGIEAVYTEDLLPAGVLGFGANRLTPALCREIRAHLRSRIGGRAKIHVTQGDPAVVILRLARTLRPDLIVMGTHGRKGWDRLRMGSVAETVVRVSPVPVLTVRSRGGPIRSILFHDPGGDGARRGLRFAEAAAAACAAKLTVSAALEKAPLLKAASHHDLLVVAARRRSLKTLLTASAAERAVRESPTPVLCLPAEPQAKTPAG